MAVSGVTVDRREHDAEQNGERNDE